MNKRTIFLPVAIASLMGITSLYGCATYNAHSANNFQLAEEARGCKETYRSGYPVQLAHCDLITAAIIQSGIKDGFATYSSTGKIVLRGTYENENEVERAFMIAQTAVGDGMLANVSELTPRNIKNIRYLAPRTLSSRTGDGSTYALLVGVKEFQSRKISSIATAEDDVDSYAKSLRDLGTPTSNIHTLKSQEATKQRIIQELATLAQKVGKNDKVFVFISSHGSQPELSSGLGIIPYDYALNDTSIGNNKEGVKDVWKLLEFVEKRRLLKQTAITGSEIFSALQAINSDKLVLVIDTCYSGAVMKEFVKPALTDTIYQKSAQQLILTPSQSQMLAFLQSTPKEVSNSGAKDIFAVEDATTQPPTHSGYKLDANQNQLLMQIQGRTGSMRSLAKAFEFPELPAPKLNKRPSSPNARIVITASSNNQRSWFQPKIAKESTFSAYFIKGLEKYDGNINDAFKYAEPRTSYAARIISFEHERGEKVSDQTPMMLSSNHPGEAPVFNIRYR